jgi:hypothetical protein|tara:strand:- start:520 stop:798 length:279 start_codon:yes stop_codon:yes gene_type:complete
LDWARRSGDRLEVLAHGLSDSAKCWWRVADWPDAEYPSWIESKQQVRPEAADALAVPGWGPIVSALDGAGHNIHRENFIDFVDAVAAFLRSI